MTAGQTRSEAHEHELTRGATAKVSGSLTKKGAATGTVAGQLAGSFKDRVEDRLELQAELGTTQVADAARSVRARLS